MNHLELHMLQSVPVSCLNRDDLNSPKTAIFGGVQRARVSSQCWKQSIREMAKELYPEKFSGVRTRLIIEPLIEALKKEKLSENEASEGAKAIADALAKFDEEKAKKENKLMVKTLYFTSPMEIQVLAKTYAKEKDVKKAIKTVGIHGIKDAADISLFGRMVASDASLKVEGVAMFSHAISTHKSDNEIDFFTAVDDNKNDDDSDAGAGMMGTLEFNSATYYRFAALNLDMLADNDHLGSLAGDERCRIVETFIKSTLMAMPGAKKGSMNGNTLPGYVLCVVRNEGHPIQLINAFEKPVNDKNGVFDKSVELLKAEYNKLKTTWDLDEVACISMPEKTLKELLAEVMKHVK